MPSRNKFAEPAARSSTAGRCPFGLRVTGKARSVTNDRREAIIIGEDWLSEHYFTTDAKSQSFQARVLARRKQWDEEDAAGTPSVRARFTAARPQLESKLAALEPASGDLAIRDEVYEPLRETLGFLGGGYRLEEEGPLLRVTQPGLVNGSPLVLIDACSVESLEDLLVRDSRTLLLPYQVDDNEKHAVLSVARLLSTLFVEGGGPQFALVFAGQWLLLAERERWAEGRYLAVDMQLMASRNDAKRGGEIDRVLTCVSAEALAPDADGDIWWSQVLEDSIKHTVGVSQDLREGSGSPSRSSRTTWWHAAAATGWSRCHNPRLKRWRSNRCAFCIASCSFSMPRRHLNSKCCPLASASMRRATASTACAS